MWLWNFYMWYMDFCERTFGTRWIAPITGWVLLFLLYQFAFKPYRRHLQEAYRLNILGWPAAPMLASYLVAFAGSELLHRWESPFMGLDNATALRNVLLIGLPGMIILGVICLVKTRNPLHAVIVMPLMMVVSFIFAYLAMAAIFLAVALIALRIFSRSKSTNTSECTVCGARMGLGRGRCPVCGATVN